MPSNIEWTEETWNPVTGCDKIGVGCKHCYAEKMAKRLQAMGQKNYANGFKVTTHDHMLDIPRKRKKPTKYFVCSMGDIAHDEVPFEFMDKVFAVTALCPQHEFIFLTKRYQRLCDYLNGENVNKHTRRDLINAAARDMTGILEVIGRDRWPLPNVKIGHSISNQADLNISYPILATTPAACRIYSYEPAQGPVDFTKVIYTTSDGLRYKADVLKGKECVDGITISAMACIDGIICGGETGSGAAPMHPSWPEKVSESCVNAVKPLFFKQWGEYMPVDVSKDGLHDVIWVSQSGKILKADSKFDKAEYPLAPMRKVGKKVAGDLLNGVQYHGWPK